MENLARIRHPSLLISLRGQPVQAGRSACSPVARSVITLAGEQTHARSRRGLSSVAIFWQVCTCTGWKSLPVAITLDKNVTNYLPTAYLSKFKPKNCKIWIEKYKRSFHNLMTAYLSKFISQNCNTLCGICKVQKYCKLLLTGYLYRNSNKDVILYKI